MVKDTDFIFVKHVPWDEKLLRGHVRTVPRNALVKFEVRNCDHIRTIDTLPYLTLPYLRGGQVLAAQR